MPTTIFKYPIEITDEQTLIVPQRWDPLSVQVQNGIPCIWAIVDPGLKKGRVKVYVRGTGHPTEGVDCHDVAFLGTIQMGSLVFHVFYDQKPA